MSKRSSAFFKRVAVSAAVSAGIGLFFAPFASSAEKGGEADALAALPMRELHLSDRGGQVLKVGDAVSYEIRGGDATAEAHWQVDPRQGGLKQGILFRPGRLITPLVAGHFQAPALIVVDEAGNPVAKTDPVEFDVGSNLPQQAGAQPPQAEPAIGPIGLPFPPWVQNAVAGTILVIFLVAAYLVFRAIRRRAARAIRAILPKKPYDAASLDRLDGLLRKGWIEKKNYKPFYFGISETLKFYLGERFDFEAQESTTSELFASLRTRIGAPGLSEGMEARIESLFDRLDPVKFADVVPSDEEARSALREAREIVLSTRKAAIEPVGAEGRATR
jgi:hypothetical protein